jgi:hypothetical protein
LKILGREIRFKINCKMQDTLQIIVGALGTEVPGEEGSLEISLDSILGILDDLIIVSLPICHRIDLDHMPVTMVDKKNFRGSNNSQTDCMSMFFNGYRVYDSKFTT